MYGAERRQLMVQRLERIVRVCPRSTEAVKFDQNRAHFRNNVTYRRQDTGNGQASETF